MKAFLYSRVSRAEFAWTLPWLKTHFSGNEKRMYIPLLLTEKVSGNREPLAFLPLNNEKHRIILKFKTMKNVKWTLIIEVVIAVANTLLNALMGKKNDKTNV